MKTPKKYQDNIKNRIITKEMLCDCLYSVNKRAKNHRDKEREYRFSPLYNNEDKAREEKEKYYEQKDKMLKIIEPICIHKEFKKFERERIYDYESEYMKYYEKNEYVYSNHYYDENERIEVEFIDIELKDKPIYNYYLFYDLDVHTFHSPLNEENLKEFVDKGLEIKEIDKLFTRGDDIKDLVSPMFVNKVLELIESKEFTYIKG